MKDITPDLTFDGVEYGRLETPWSLNSLVYKGASQLPIDKATPAINRGVFGSPNPTRIPLAEKFFNILQGAIVAGKSPATLKGAYQRLRKLYKWSDENNFEITESTVESIFLDWSDSLIAEARAKNTNSDTPWTCAVAVGALIDEALNRERQIISYTRLRKKYGVKGWRKTGEKINFEKLFVMGEALLDVCNSLSRETIQGDLPALLKFRSGKELEHWCRLVPSEKLKNGLDGATNKSSKRALWISDTSWRTRHPLINLRLEAELLIFIAQTQMNLSQASRLENGKFTYQSFSGGYHVKSMFKERRQGEVEFDVHSEYRTHFETYLGWRNSLFPVEGLLFPLTSHFQRASTTSTNFAATRKLLKQIDVEYISPRSLRLAKVNWLLRKIRDPNLVAEMAQHEESTLLSQYERPSYQAALAEITRYHQKTDPAFSPPGPGVCVKPTPLAANAIPKNAPAPDCANPAGCLFCQHQRDIADIDHVWSLFSYRHLKSLELASQRPNGAARDKHPAQMAIEEITRKIAAYKEVEAYKAWVIEAGARIEEGRYHPKWNGFVRLMEMRV
ncbi:site-specific integrase [Pseudomonas sp. FSL W5-0299]|uniref:site-specific integrase n=1 Tax=Pseudomonas sp. FSL W5-0299 TaxID=1917484 RepID=UPI0009CEAA54|nr:site-specific integrase [Pseudomonas sp. FSL W5-0299]OOL39399.1 hypothetical protein BOO94_00205 [Pseudomonas sp. FSL W5-0299]